MNKYHKPDIQEIRELLNLSNTLTNRQIYDYYYKPNQEAVCNFKSFSRKMKRWKDKYLNDLHFLESANLAYSFDPYKSTVQVNKNGEIIQAWIKQNKNTDDYINEIIKAIKDNIKPIEKDSLVANIERNRMLEIPLFDMHFGICDYDYYKPTLCRLIEIINNNYWDEINIIIGQDLLHNDDFEGRTTKGTNIEKIDMRKAWNDAKQFYFEVITACLEKSKNIKIYYSKGNHDKSMSWAFIQLLKALFPNLEYNDDLKARKCIYWKQCFIGFGHCEYKKSKSIDLFKQFVSDFPEEYSKSTVKEVHSGHLHCESGEDNGIMIRRLPTGNKVDEFLDNNGYVGAHRRFMIFEYTPGFLASIRYI